MTVTSNASRVGGLARDTRDLLTHLEALERHVSLAVGAAAAVPVRTARFQLEGLAERLDDNDRDDQEVDGDDR